MIVKESAFMFYPNISMSASKEEIQYELNEAIKCELQGSLEENTELKLNLTRAIQEANTFKTKIMTLEREGIFLRAKLAQAEKEKEKYKTIAMMAEKNAETKFKEIVYIGEIMKYPDLVGSAAQILYEFIFSDEGPWGNSLIFLEVEKRRDIRGELSAFYMRRGFVPTHLFYQPFFTDNYTKMKDIGDFFQNEYEQGNLMIRINPRQSINFLQKPGDNPQTTNHLFVLFPLLIEDRLKVIEADKDVQQDWERRNSHLLEASSSSNKSMLSSSEMLSEKPNSDRLEDDLGLFISTRSVKKRKKSEKTLRDSC